VSAGVVVIGHGVIGVGGGGVASLCYGGVTVGCIVCADDRWLLMRVLLVGMLPLSSMVPCIVSKQQQ